MENRRVMYAFVRGKVASNEVRKSNTEEEKGSSQNVSILRRAFYSLGGERRNFMIHLIFLYMDT